MKNKLFVCLIVAILALPSSLIRAVENSPEIPDEILQDKEKQFVTLNIENDLFGSGTDENYTSGVSLSYFNTRNLPGTFSRWLSKRLPMFSINKTTSTYVTVGQNLYTPSDIRVPNQLENERPWAAFLYGSIGLATISHKHIDELETTIGVVGPAALGKPVQKFIHKSIDSPIPQGWDNQLENEPGFMLSWQRRWPKVWNKSAVDLTLSAVPHLGATVGNIYTYANSGVTFHVSPSGTRFQDTPPRVRPAMPGTGFFHVRKDKFSWYLFAGVDGRMVLRNIFLDGNTFTHSHSVPKRPFVADLSTGLALTYGKTRLSYTLNYRTREFDGQKDPSIFGAISIGRRF